jgi:glucose-6-phosphate 1-dehydrogenase
MSDLLPDFRLEQAMNEPNGRPLRSDALVFFGATGDLAYKKIFPSLQSMIQRGQLDLPIIGVAFSKWTLEQLQNRARESLQASKGGLDSEAFAKLIAQLKYVDGDYRDPATFEKLRAELGSAARPLHYLAIPPSLFATVTEGLGRSGCAKNARVVVEKPFGRDRVTARALNRALYAVFPESAIFRIDHFLGKEAVQNLIYFRFGNTFLEPIWNRNYVKSVQITMAEKFGVEGRGKLYEELGAIRDVVQNHLLQVIGFLAMEPPVSTYNDSLRDEQVKIFHAIRPLDQESLVRGQYAGYRKEAGVSAYSQVETFAALRLHIDSWRWQDVPFFIRAGKKMAVTVTEVVVELKKPPLAKFFPHRGNYFRFRLNPDVSIAIGARIKHPGESWNGDTVELSALKRSTSDEMDAYERLLGDAIDGESMLFTRADAVDAAWAIVEPILGNSTPAYEYEPGTFGPGEADQVIGEAGHWVDPKDTA